MGGVDKIIQKPEDFPEITKPVKEAPPMEPLANFDRAVEKILRREGGYVDHPNDRGGATNFGITIGTLAAWRGRAVTKEEVRALTVDEAKQIYKKNYWDPMMLDGLHEYLAESLFDQAVNFGPGAAARRVRVVLNNKFGQKLMLESRMTQDAKLSLLAVPWRKFLKEFICETQDSYVRIVVSNPSQLVFLAGWINRSQELMDYLV
jgi:lysozyme family protein